MKFIGPHVSIAGGVENAPLNAAALGATGFAMFTKNQRQWSAPPLSETSVAAFRENCRAGGFRTKQANKRRPNTCPDRDVWTADFDLEYYLFFLRCALKIIRYRTAR